MNLLHLRYFKKVVETKNITQAAKELYISQPALSKSLKALETELGYPLFFHKGRNIELTIFSQEFYPYVIQSLNALDKGMEVLTSLVTPSITAITLHLEVASVSIPNLVKIFQEEYPDIHLTIVQHDMPKEEQQQIFHISAEKKAVLTNLPLFTEPIYVAIPKKHPLAKKTQLVTADILTIPFLMLSENNSLRKTIDQSLNNRGIELITGSVTDDPATLRSLLNQGLGFSFFPSISWIYRENDAFILKEISDLPLTRTIYLSSSYTNDNPLPKTFATILKKFYLH